MKPGDAAEAILSQMQEIQRLTELNRKHIPMTIKELVDMWRSDALQMATHRRTNQAACMRRCADDLMNESNAGRIIDAPPDEEEHDSKRAMELVARYKNAIAGAQLIERETAGPNYVMSDTSFDRCVRLLFEELCRR